MRTNHIKNLLTLTVMACMISLSACGEEEDTTIRNSRSTISEYTQMAQNQIYILHSDNTLETPYFGQANFKYGDINANDGDDTGGFNDEHKIMWFKDDWGKIPTMYEGDHLIMFTTEVLDETFTYERFEDFGYSVGLCGMTPSLSNRFMISTNPEDCCTYPGGDTDELLYLTNETVIMDMFAGMHLTFPVELTDKEKEDLDEDYVDEVEKNQILTRVGTIANLQKGQKYSAMIYAGTELPKEYIFTADVRVLGSMQSKTTNDYTFIDGNIIRLDVPEWFNTGYYYINGQGMIRIVRGTEALDDSNPDLFNIPNEDPSLKEGYDEEEYDIREGDPDSYAAYEPDTPLSNTDSDQVGYKETFTVQEEGNVHISMKFYVDGNRDYEKYHVAYAAVYDANGIEVAEFADTDEEFEVSFYASELGDYTVKVKNLAQGLEVETSYN